MTTSPPRQPPRYKPPPSTPYPADQLPRTNYQTRELPPLPFSPTPEDITITPKSLTIRRRLTAPSPISPSSSSSHQWRTSPDFEKPKSPMTLSDKKVLQLTGYNPNLEPSMRAGYRSKEVSAFEGDSDDEVSSEGNTVRSKFSLQRRVRGKDFVTAQRSGNEDEYNIHPKSRTRPPINPTNHSQKRTPAPLPLHTIPPLATHKPYRTPPPIPISPLTPSPTSIYSTSTNPSLLTPSPSPRNSQKKEVRFTNKLGSPTSLIITNIKDSLARGVEVVALPARGRRESEPSTGTGAVWPGSLFTEDNKKSMKTPPRTQIPQKTWIETGNHPLKSPFPKTFPPDTPSSPSSPTSSTKLARALSNTIRNISHSKSSLNKRNYRKDVLGNKEREVRGPSTPFPGSRGLGGIGGKKKGWLGLGKGDGGEERWREMHRREVLGRGIHVVGNSSLGPDGRVSEFI